MGSGPRPQRTRVEPAGGVLTQCRRLSSQRGSGTSLGWDPVPAGDHGALITQPALGVHLRLEGVRRGVSREIRPDVARLIAFRGQFR